MVIKKNISNGVKKVIANSVLYLSFLIIILGSILLFTCGGFWFPMDTIVFFIMSMFYLWVSAMINHILAETLKVYSHQFVLFCEILEIFYLLVLFFLAYVLHSMFLIK